MNKIDFNDTETAYEERTNGELRSAARLFRMMRSPGWVRLGSALVHFANKLRIPIAWLVKPTLYKQFVAGETLDESLPRLNDLKEQDVKAAPDYSAEGGRSEEDTLHIYSETMESIRFASEHRNLVSHAVFKPGGLVTVATLTQFAEAPETLSEEQKEEISLFHSRFMGLCQAASDMDIPVLIDAEQYVCQRVVDRFAEEAMRTFNKHNAIVSTTLQMYRTDRPEYLRKLYAMAEEEDLQIGIKLVRGAYMDGERRRAAEKGYPSPICANKPVTDAQYNEAVRFILAHIDRFSLFCGTHNEESCLLVANEMERAGLAPSDARVTLAQLYGMGDYISFNLAKAGYNVTKYVPYGPVRKVMPYLLRRTTENSSMSGQTPRELSLIRKELKRRRIEKEA